MSAYFLQKDFIVTEIQIASNTPIEEIVSHLRSQRTTGQLTFHLIDGGIRSITATVRTKPSEPLIEKIREMLST